MDQLENGRHELYCIARAQGHSQEEAYRKAYGKHNAAPNGARLERREDIKARISTLRWVIGSVDKDDNVLIISSQPEEKQEDTEARLKNETEPDLVLTMHGGAIDNVNDKAMTTIEPQTLLEHVAQKQQAMLQELERVAVAEVPWEDVKPGDKVRALQAYLTELRELMEEGRRHVEQQAAEGKAERDRLDEEHREWLHQRTALDRARDVVEYLKHAKSQGYSDIDEVLEEASQRIELMQSETETCEE